MKSPKRSYSKQKKGISPNRFTKMTPNSPIRVMRDNPLQKSPLTSRPSTKQLISSSSRNHSNQVSNSSLRLNQQQIVEYDQRRRELMKQIEENEAQKQMMLDDIRPQKAMNG